MFHYLLPQEIHPRKVFRTFSNIMEPGVHEFDVLRHYRIAASYTLKVQSFRAVS